MSARTYETLIDAAELPARPQTPQWLLVDCRFDLARPQAGEAAYRAGHIPGAIYAHLERHLSGPLAPGSGRHPLPSPEQWAATLSSWGLSSSTQVVAYDADNGMYAARLWWLLRWAGHHAVAVLDGGFKAWLQAGLPVDTQIPTRTASSCAVHARHDAWIRDARGQCPVSCLPDTVMLPRSVQSRRRAQPGLRPAGGPGMALELYWGSGSPYTWRVLLALEYKRLPYASRLLQFSKQEHKSPQMLRMNPRGRVTFIAGAPRKRATKRLAGFM